MPSYRYTRDIPPEKLVQEAPPEYTKKEKAKNWWHYHWKWLLVALALAVLLIVFIVEQVRTVHPDITVGILAPYALPTEVTEALEDRFAQAAGDLNGDGKLAARVEVFTIDFSGNEDPNLQMAGVTKLMASFETGEVMLFMAAPEQVDDYQAAYGIFADADGSYNEAGDAAALTVAFSELPGLTAESIEIPYGTEDGTITIDGRDLLANYRVGMRALYGTKLEDDAEDSEAWHRVEEILEALKAGG